MTTIRYVENALRINLAPDSKRFISRFIEPGLISYADQPGGGIELLRKETIDKCIASVMGNPVTIGHVVVTPENRVQVMQGAVDQFRYDTSDGWYYCEGSIDTDAARSAIRRGQSPSCGYVVKGFGPGGVYHGIRYDREITDIEFNHLAIVERPRYEGANFRLNSINLMFKFLKKIVRRENAADGSTQEITETQASEVSPQTAVEIDGKMVRLNDLVGTWKTQAGQVFTASADDEIEIDGAPVKMNALIAAYRKNASEEDEKKRKDEEARNNAAAEEQRQNAAAEEAKKKEEEARNNAAAADAAQKQKDAEAFQRLHQASSQAAVVAPTPAGFSGSLPDRVRLGQSRYGSAPVVPGKN